MANKWRIEAVDRPPPPVVVVVMGVAPQPPGRQAAKGEILHHMTRRNGQKKEKKKKKKKQKKLSSQIQKSLKGFLTLLYIFCDFEPPSVKVLKSSLMDFFSFALLHV